MLDVRVRVVLKSKSPDSVSHATLAEGTRGGQAGCTTLLEERVLICVRKGLEHED